MRKVLYILGQLSDLDTHWLARHGTRRQFAAGSHLIVQGTRIDTLYFVLDGALNVTRRGTMLARLGAGDVLGEMSLIDSSPTAADVYAETNVRVLAIPQVLVREKLDSDTPFAARFYRALALFLADRMRNTLGNLGYGDADEDPGALLPDELDAEVLDNVYLAGARFERLLKQLDGVG